MKRTFCLLLSVLLLLLPLTGCSQKPANESKSTADTADAPEQSAGAALTAAALAQITVPELIGLMGGVYSCEQDAKTFYRTAFPDSYSEENDDDYGFYIYNYDVFPGMIFYIGDNASSDYFLMREPDEKEQAVSEMKKRLNRGDYSEIDEITLFGSARLDDTFSADMDYRQVTEAFGSFPSQTFTENLVVQEIFDYCEAIRAVRIYYQTAAPVEPYQDDLVSKAVMREENPQIAFIQVHPNNPQGWQRSCIDYLKNYYADTDWSGYFLNLANGSLISEIVVIDEDGQTPTKLLHIDPAASVNEEILGTDTDTVLYLENGNKILHAGYTDGVTTITVYHLDAMGPDSGGFTQLYTAQYEGDVSFSAVVSAYLEEQKPDVKAYMDENGKALTESEFFSALNAVFDVSDFTCTNLLTKSPFKKLNAEYSIMHH